MTKQAVLFASFFCLALAGCAALDPTAVPSATPTVDPQAEWYAVFELGQASIGDLGISARDFGIKTYTDLKGGAQTGLTCELTFFVQDQQERTERAYLGKAFEVAGHRVVVDAIEKSASQRGVVFLTISEPG